MSIDMFYFFSILCTTQFCMSMPLRLMRYVKPPPIMHMITAASKNISNRNLKEGGIRTYSKCPSYTNGVDQRDDGSSSSRSKHILYQIFAADDFGFFCWKNLCGRQVSSYFFVHSQPTYLLYKCSSYCTPPSRPTPQQRH